MELKLTKWIVVIGCGGIAEHLLHQLNLMLRMSGEARDPYRLRLVDGDVFQPHNHQRQVFTHIGNKAQARASHLEQMNAAVRGCTLRIEAVPKFVSDDPTQILLDNVCHPRDVIPEGAVVFCCVDDHGARKILSNHLRTLQNGVLINGGNDLDSGDTHIYIRANGTDMTPPLTFYPGIQEAKPRDHTPGCNVEAVRHPQLVITNAMAAVTMLSLWYTLTSGKNPAHKVVFSVSAKAPGTPDLHGPGVRGTFVSLT